MHMLDTKKAAEPRKGNTPRGATQARLRRFFVCQENSTVESEMSIWTRGSENPVS